jgi:ribosomal protein L37AE/L43A
MAKGFACPECGSQTAQHEKGAYHCGNAECGIIWWTAFDKPAAGVKRKGFTCFSCARMTMHPIGVVAGAEIWRCSTCAATIIASQSEENAA